MSSKADNIPARGPEPKAPPSRPLRGEEWVAEAMRHLFDTVTAAKRA